MKKSFLMMWLSFATLLVSAQKSHQFTLEELIPGGKDYFKFAPQIPGKYQWHGDQLILQKKDSFFVAPNPLKHHIHQFLFTLSGFPEVNEKVYNAVFDAEGGNIIQLHTANSILLYNITTKTIQSTFSYPHDSKNHTLSPNKKWMAYTIDNNLFLMGEDGKEVNVSSDDNAQIVYGSSVHRDEFGISKGVFWSPDNMQIAFYRMDESMVEDYPLVDASQREAKLKAIKYPMAGMTSHEVTVGVYNIKNNKTVYLKTGLPKDHFLTNVTWNPQSNAIYIAELNREQNHMWLNRYNTQTGELETTLFEETHSKYVEPENPVLFVSNNPSQFVWQSKRDGYNHLYLYNTSGHLIKQLTKGNWDVTQVNGFDKNAQHLFFTSTHPTPMERHLYSVEMKTGKTKQYTKAEGIHNCRISSSGRYIIDQYSSHNNPGIIDLIGTSTNHRIPLSFANNPFEGIIVPSIETGTIKAADNKTDLHYRMVKPAEFDSTRKYPVAIYVYGGPHSQLVQNRWRYASGGWEMYMAQKGYIVFVLDNRGTAFRGLSFENVTHRQLGVEEAKDQMKGVEFLHSLPYVDKERMGIHGWSYGGFMTINMLLRYPDIFKVGVAGGPVTDWKYYEVMYGERYMDTPQENPEGYEETSLLNKTNRLNSRLLIIHGDEDPTVVLQHSLQYLKSSIENGTHPDFFIYTGHGHNMIGKDRVHLHEHITRYFDDFCM